MKSVYSFLLLAAIAFFMVTDVHAQAKVVWANGGVGTATSSNAEYLNTTMTSYPLKNMNITDDGLGGMIMTWATYVSGSYYIQAQRINSAGALMWTTSGAGMQVQKSGTNYYRVSQCVGDNAGGAYIAWCGTDPSTNTEKHFIQHVSATGALLWGATGYILTPSGYYSLPYSTQGSYIQMEKDGAGGAMVTYYAYTSSTTTGTVYAARVSGTGATPTFGWTGAPIAILAHTGSETMYSSVSPVICSDRSQGAWIAWHTYQSPLYYNRLAHINSSGSVVVNRQLQSSSYYAQGSYGYQIVNDGGTGGIIMYVPTSSPAGRSNQIQGIGFDGNGNLRWGPAALCGAYDYYQYYGRMASDGAGGAYVVHYDGWNWGGMQLEHISSTGSLLFNPYGSPAGKFLDGPGTSSYPPYIDNTYGQVINDGVGNAIVSWTQNNTVYIQKYRASDGATMWGSGGFSIGANGTYPQLTSDNIGGAFMTWMKSGTSDLWSQHVIDLAMAPQGKCNLTTLNFGTARVGTPLTLSGLTVQSTAGSFPLTVGGSSSAFGRAAISTAMPINIPLNTTAPLTASFNPPRNGLTYDTLFILTTDPVNSPYKVIVSGTGIYPHFSGFDTMNVAATHAGGSVTYQRDYVITNTGTDYLTINGASFTGGDASNFTVLSTFPFTILPGVSKPIRIGFTPTTAASKVTTMLIQSDDSVATKSVQVSGRGIVPHLVAANAVAFPFTVVDLRSSQRSLLISNSGTEDLIIKPGTNITGTNASEFSIVSTPLPLTIAPGTTGQINLQFTPVVTLGPRSATLNVVSNFDSTLQLFGTTNYLVSLTGTGVDGAPDMQFAQQVNFGRLHVNKFDTVTFRITNTANATKRLIIRDYSLAGPFAGSYKIVNPPSVPDTIGIPGYRDLRIRFVASQEGTIPASLRMATNAADYPVEVPLFGTGVKGSVSANPVAFGKVALNVCKDTTLHIVNYGADALTISSFSLVGPAALAYTVVGNATMTIPAAGSGDIHLRFCPVNVGNADVTGRIITSDGDTTLVAITGTGANAGSLQAATSMDFGLVAITQTINKQLHVTNSGDIPVTITDVHFTGAATTAYSTNLTVPTVIDAGASIDVNIAFSSNTGGQKDANIVFVTSDNGATSVSLKGWATPDPFAAEPRQLFDTTIASGTQTSELVHVANFTTGPRQIQALAITGPGASAYRISHPFSWPLDVNGQGNDSVVVTFSPQSVGLFMATLEMTLSPATAGDPSETIRIALTGSGRTPTDVRTGDALPQACALWQNYPNPFTNVTSIAFSVPDRSPVSLKLYDVMGRMVRELVNGTREAGTYDVELSSDGLAAGLYTYELTYNGITKSRVMQVVK